jgi:hypothetical protein
MDDDEDFYPEGPVGPFAEPDTRSFLEKVSTFVLSHGFSLLIAVLLLGLGAVLWFRPANPVLTQASYSVVQPGMSFADVCTVLGGKPTGKPRIPPPQVYSEEIEGKRVSRPVEWHEWRDGGIRVIIGFVDGRVWFKVAEGSLPSR